MLSFPSAGVRSLRQILTYAVVLCCQGAVLAGAAAGCRVLRFDRQQAALPESRVQSSLSRDEAHLLEASQRFPLAEYLAACEEAMGPAPVVSCQDVSPYDYGATDVVNGTALCARPSLNNPAHACVPGTGVARYSSVHTVSGQAQAVDWVLICSKVLPDPVPMRFHSIDFIGYNRATGDACFFKNAEVNVARIKLEGKNLASLDGANLAPLSRRTDAAGRLEAERSWSMPFGTAGNCTTCHGNGPWLRSYVHRGLKAKDGQPVVPQRIVGQPGPYRIVARERLRDAAQGYLANDAHPVVRANPSKQWDPRWLANPRVVASCGSCHAVADEHYCGINVKAAYGIMDGDTAQLRRFSEQLIRPEGGGGAEPGATQVRRTSLDSAHSWHRRMHPAAASKGTAEGAMLDQVLAEIDACCARPEAPQCRWLSPDAYIAEIYPATGPGVPAPSGRGALPRSP